MLFAAELSFLPHRGLEQGATDAEDKTGRAGVGINIPPSDVAVVAAAAEGFSLDRL